MAHAPLSPSTPMTVSQANGLLDGTTIPEIDPDATLTLDEITAHLELCHETIQRIYARQAEPRSPHVRRVLRNGRIVCKKISEYRLRGVTPAN